jgi:predicted transposase/invertase (TIGR01784 family)
VISVKKIEAPQIFAQYIGMKHLDINTPTQRFNPLNDFLFFKVMGEKGNEIQLLGFLNAVLSQSGKKSIESVEILENQSFVKDIINGKSCVLDVLAVLSDGTKVNIEVQLSNQVNMERRSLYYWSKVYFESLNEGHDYRELPNVIAINIIDFDFLPYENVHTCFNLREAANPSLILSQGERTI